jgi:hypothetical protein
LTIVLPVDYSLILLVLIIRFCEDISLYIHHSLSRSVIRQPRQVLR